VTAVGRCGSRAGAASASTCSPASARAAAVSACRDRLGRADPGGVRARRCHGRC
jgi:hypothetical protein